MTVRGHFGSIFLCFWHRARAWRVLSTAKRCMANRIGHRWRRSLNVAWNKWRRRYCAIRRIRLSRTPVRPTTPIFACQFRVLRTSLHRNLTHPCSSLMLLKWRGAPRTRAAANRGANRQHPYTTSAVTFVQRREVRMWTL